MSDERITEAEIAELERRTRDWPENIFGDMEVLVEGELHFRAHDGACIVCGQGHSTTHQSFPAGTFSILPKLLAERREREGKLAELFYVREEHGKALLRAEAAEEQIAALQERHALGQMSDADLAHAIKEICNVNKENS